MLWLLDASRCSERCGSPPHGTCKLKHYHTRTYMRMHKNKHKPGTRISTKSASNSDEPTAQIGAWRYHERLQVGGAVGGEGVAPKTPAIAATATAAKQSLSLPTIDAGAMVAACVALLWFILTSLTLSPSSWRSASSVRASALVSNQLDCHAARPLHSYVSQPTHFFFPASPPPSPLATPTMALHINALIVGTAG